MEKLTNTEKIKPVTEGGLEAGIQKMREKITTLTSMVDQLSDFKRSPMGTQIWEIK